MSGLDALLVGEQLDEIVNSLVACATDTSKKTLGILCNQSTCTALEGEVLCTVEAIIRHLYDNGTDVSCLPVDVIVLAPQHGYHQLEQMNMIESKSSILRVAVSPERVLEIPCCNVYDASNVIVLDSSTQHFKNTSSSSSSSSGRSSFARLLSDRNVGSVIVDLLDVGSRIYTYQYTLLLLIREAYACDHSVDIIVCDRLNPIGHAVSGPMMCKGLVGKSFVSMFPMPLRHGMTIGELAQMFFSHEQSLVAPEKRFQVSLTVVPVMKSNSPSSCLTFNPSPNLNSVACAEVYFALVVVEATNLSEGRGTTMPFLTIGAPWFDYGGFVQFLRTHSTAFGSSTCSYRMLPHSFRPTFDKYQGIECHGFKLVPIPKQDAEPSMEDAKQSESVLLNEEHNEKKQCVDDVFEFSVLLLSYCCLHHVGEFAFREPCEGYEYNFEHWAVDLILGDPAFRENLFEKLQAFAVGNPDTKSMPLELVEVLHGLLQGTQRAKEEWEQAVASKFHIYARN